MMQLAYKLVPFLRPWFLGRDEGFANPMTTAGDIITGGTAGAVQRLGVGAEGDVLTVVSGTPAWATPDSGLPWFNVVDYGATGNGTTDDTSAVTSAITALTSAGGGVLYFPKGTYKTSGGFTLSVPFLAIGDGAGQANDGYGYSNSQITCTSATATLFTVTTNRGTFKDLTLRNTAASTPSAGAGISVTGVDYAASIHYDHINVVGFYINVDIQRGYAWTMHGCFIYNAKKYGVKIRNTANGDAGDWSISNCQMHAVNAMDATIRIESSGGGKIVNTKLNGNVAGAQPNHQIDLTSSTNTAILLVANCSIENYDGDGIHLNTSTWQNIAIVGCQFGQWNNSTGNAISATNIVDLIVDACLFRSASSPTNAISLTSCTRVYVGAATKNGFTNFLTQSGSTGVIDMTAGGFANPMTTAGDVITGGSAGAAQRLAVGSNGQVLTVVAGAPAWATPSAAATLDDLTDVTISSPATADRLRYDGSVWRNSAKVWQPLTNGSTSSPELIFAGGDVIMVEV